MWTVDVEWKISPLCCWLTQRCLFYRHTAKALLWVAVSVFQKHNGRRKTTRLQGLYTLNNKKLYGFSGSEENMVLKLAQPEKKHQSSTQRCISFLISLAQSWILFSTLYFRRRETRVHVKELIVSLHMLWQQWLPSEDLNAEGRAQKVSSHYFAFVRKTL